MVKILILLIVGVGLATAKYDCAPRACKPGTTYTMCLYKSPKPAPRCGQVRAASVTEAEKQEIVKLHNYYRALVASGQETRGSHGPQPAGEIRPLKWNDKLAEVAQRWVNQCLGDHDQCRSDGHYHIGQNYAERSSYPREPKLSDLIRDWYDEVKDFNKNQVGSFKGSNDPQHPIGHYTQMVWGETTEIGCGIIKNYVPSGRIQMSQIMLVCNYGPGGNRGGSPVYKTYY